MKRFVALFVVLSCALIAMPSMGMAQDANREAVIHQAYYALDPSESGTSSQTINGNYVGDWNWLDSNLSAYSYVYGLFGCNASNFATSGDSCPNLTGHPVSSFYSNPSGYGHSPIIPEVAYGRGGQCVYFGNLVFYRAIGYSSGFNKYTLWTALNGNTNSNMQLVQAGDVIVRYYNSSLSSTSGNYGYVDHVAIVVAVYKSGSSVTSVDVVDSDYFPDYVSGVSFPEVITRHNFSISTLQGHFNIWDPPGY